jgi:hypothetical protein
MPETRDRLLQVLDLGMIQLNRATTNIKLVSK